MSASSFQGIPSTRAFEQDLWDSKKQRFCCWKVNIGCPETHYKTRTHVKTRVKYVKVPVPTPPKIIVRRHVAKQELQSFDCSQGFSNWWKGWSPLKKTYCCAHEMLASNSLRYLKLP